MIETSSQKVTVYNSNFGDFNIISSNYVAESASELAGMPVGLIKRIRSEAEKDAALVYSRIAIAHAICEIPRFRHKLEVIQAVYVEPAFDPFGKIKAMDQLAVNRVFNIARIMYDNKMTAVSNPAPVMGDVVYSSLVRETATALDFTADELLVVEAMKIFITEAFAASSAV